MTLHEETPWLTLHEETPRLTPRGDKKVGTGRQQKGMHKFLNQPPLALTLKTTFLNLKT